MGALDDLSKRHFRRNFLAKSYKAARTAEQNHFFETYRDDYEYLEELEGYEILFQYTSGLQNKNVLDVGIGKGFALQGFSKNPFSKNLSFYGTSLYRNNRFRDLGIDKNVIISGVEDLSRFKQAALSCVIGVYSVTYSPELRVAAMQVDRILEKGGVCKFAFLNNPNKFPRPRAYKHKLFVSILKRLGYDVSIDQTVKGKTVVLAVKPGNAMAPSAESLLSSDKKTLASQQNRLQNFRDANCNLI